MGAEPPLSIFSVTTLYTCRSLSARNEASHRRGCGGGGVGAAEPVRCVDAEPARVREACEDTASGTVRSVIKVTQK